MSPLTDKSVGKELYQLAQRLFPLHRSISGEGVRETFGVLEELISLERLEIPTGTEVFDWTVPKEWRIRDAYIADARGNRVVDYRDSNLHVVNYSQPVKAKMNWSELQPFVHALESKPEAIPYRTTYFRDNWGFCVKQKQLDVLSKGGPWEVVIDSEFRDGSLSIAECNLAGELEQTVVLYAHTCHPSLVNDNLSGIVLATYLARWLANKPRKFSYRIVFAPATIGAISWLSHQEEKALDSIQYGLVLALLGDNAGFSFKNAGVESCRLNQLVPYVFEALGLSLRQIPFSPVGYDERQFSSPGLKLPIGRLCRSDFGEFEEYHTSDDNFDLVTAENLSESFAVCQAIIRSIEANSYPLNLKPFGEPNLGKHGLYRAFGERDDRGRLQEAMMWILNLADGQNDMVAICEKSKLPLFDLIEAADLLQEHGLLAQNYVNSSGGYKKILTNQKMEMQTPR